MSSETDQFLGVTQQESRGGPTRIGRNQGLISWLRGLGGTVIGIGVIVAIVIIGRASDAGVFRSDELAFYTLCTAIGIGFYHIVGGVICFGIAKVLEEAGRPVVVHATSPSAGRKASTKCPKCGKEYEGDIRGEFCEECGTQL